MSKLYQDYSEVLLPGDLKCEMRDESESERNSVITCSLSVTSTPGVRPAATM